MLIFIFYIYRGLLEKDKMVFSCLIAAQIQRQRGVISNTEWNMLLRGVGEGARGSKPDALSWITPAQWNICSALEASVPAFEGLVSDITSHATAWREYINCPEPRILLDPVSLLSSNSESFFYQITETTPLPGKWETNLSPFQRLLILKCFREEKLIFAFPDFITATLDKDFIELPQFDLARAFTDTSHKTPLIFILSTGADPTSYPRRFLFCFTFSSRFLSRYIL